LHADDGKYVDDDDQHEREVAERSDCRYDNAQKYFHGGPRLSQFQDAELTAEHNKNKNVMSIGTT